MRHGECPSNAYYHAESGQCTGCAAGSEPNADRTEFGDDGDRFDGKVRSYKSGYHKVYYKDDGETVSHNFYVM